MHLKRGKIRPGQLSVLAEAGRVTVVLSALQNWLKDVQFPVTPVDLYFSTVSQRRRRGGQGAGLPYKKGRGCSLVRRTLPPDLIPRKPYLVKIVLHPTPSYWDLCLYDTGQHV